MSTTVPRRKAPTTQHEVDAIQPWDRWWSVVVEATHIIVSGGKGSGKSTLVRAIMLWLARQGATFVLVDPHHKRGEWGPGIRPLAAGRRFEEARQAFAWGNAELDRRFKARADEGVDNWPVLVFIVDEFDLFTNKRPDVSDELRNLASRFLSMIGDESRKVEIRLIVIAHGTEVGNLGLEGYGSKRDNYTVVKLRQGPDKLPEKTGLLLSGSTRWTIDTQLIPEHAVGLLQPNMFVELPAEDDTPLPNDPTVLQRQVRALQQEIRIRAAAPAKVVEVPVWTDEQFTRLEAALNPVIDILREMANARPSQPSAHVPTVTPAADAPVSTPTLPPSHASATKQTVVVRRPKRHAPMNEIDHILAIHAVAAKVEQARKIVLATDASAHRYIRNVLHTLWQKELRPEDIAEGRGTGARTVARLRVVCRALAQVKLLVERDAGKMTVNQTEIERLCALDRALHT